MLRLSKTFLTFVGLIFITGLISIFIINNYWLQGISAAPLTQYPLNSVLVISDPSGAAAPGQFAERTWLEDTFWSPPVPINWETRDFDDSAWATSSLIVEDPANWGTAPLGNPATLADFIWQGDLANPGGGGRFYLPSTPGPQQFLFLRKGFCVAINADPASITPNGNLQIQIAATPGDATVYYNGPTVQTGINGSESNVSSIDLSATTNYRGKNILAIQANDILTTPAPLQAAVAFEFELNYAIDPAALFINPLATPAVANIPTIFSETNDGLSGYAPYTYAWNFGDGTTSTAATPSHTYLNPGTYTTVLTITDSFGCLSAPVIYTHTVLASPPLSVTISGPTVGLLNTAYNFTANVLPITTTLPLSYTWSATDLGTSGPTSINNLSDIANFTWTTYGTKTITVVAQNAAGIVTDTHLIYIQPNPLLAVNISGPTTGITGVSYPFTATATSITATLPVDYSWQVDGQAGPINVTGAGLSDGQSFTWNTPGVYTLTVTANNPAGVPVVSTHIIVISAANIPLTDVTISGPVTGLTNTAYSFTADVLPVTATIPITYNWTVAGGVPASVTNSSNNPADTQSFSWATPGTYTITVTANNPAGVMVTDTHVIVISDAVIPLTSVTISGPTTGLIGTSYNFTADILPVTATTPITYNWTVVGGLPAAVTNASANPADTQSFSWATPGTYTITVTANNPSGNVVVATHVIIISDVVIPLISVTISGPTTGNTGTAYSFTADVQPITATTSITYNWVASGGTPSTPTAVNGVSDTQSFTWNTPGVYTITVTATNQGGSVVDTHVITITQIDIDLISIAIGGATNGTVGTAYNFTATINPNNATLPLDYAWQVDGQTAVNVSGSNSRINTQSFTWNSPGVYVLTTTATNSLGTNVFDTHSIVINTNVPPLSVQISGPASGLVGQNLSFAALVTPSSASTPLTYVWTAQGQTSVTNVDNNAVSFRWNTPGTYLVTVTVSNAAGSVTDSLTVIITLTPTATSTPKPSSGGSSNNNPTATPLPTPIAISQAPLLLPETGMVSGVTSKIEDTNHILYFISGGLIALLGCVVWWYNKRRT